jgi:hypothetical protein
VPRPGLLDAAVERPPGSRRFVEADQDPAHVGSLCGPPDSRPCSELGDYRVQRTSVFRSLPPRIVRSSTRPTPRT